MSLEGRSIDPRFRDPSRFPCAVSGCQERAHGWVHHLDLPEALEVRADMERVYLCTEHLEVALPGWSGGEVPRWVE